MAQNSQWPSLQTKLESVQPPTIEDLQKYSTANLDPWTVQLGQVLCDRFQFAALGHRNLANVLNSLPGEHFKQSNFEVGFGSRHVLHVLLRSPEGSTLAAVTGVLGEYFHEDFVVDFFRVLTRLADVPIVLQPLEGQWKRMVKVLYGVLATSSFGQLVTSAEGIAANIGTDIDIQNVIRAMESMSTIAQKKEKSAIISCGSDIAFQTAIATWLFDLKYNVVAADGATRATGNSTSNYDAEITFKLSETSAVLASPETDTSPRYHYPVDIFVVGGRVPFESIFKSTFGPSFTNIKNDVLATYLASSSQMMHDHLDTIGRGSEFSFLPHYRSSGSGHGFGFIDTMVGWFPELHRLSSRFERLSKISIDDAKIKFQESYEALKATCGCSICGSVTATQPGFCAVTVVESIVSLGLYVTRMIVQPGLYPKVNAVRKLAVRIQQVRMEDITNADPVEGFMKRIGRTLPTSTQMLKMGTNIFSNSVSKEIDTQTDLMGLTHSGLVIFINGGSFKDPPNVKVAERDKNPTTIRVTNGWMCVFGHEAVMEVYTSRSTGWTFEQQWEQIKLRNNVLQILKWHGSLLLSSLMPADPKEEAQAEAQGWIVVR